jgi:hypothetical protein
MSWLQLASNLLSRISSKQEHPFAPEKKRIPQAPLLHIELLVIFGLAKRSTRIPLPRFFAITVLDKDGWQRSVKYAPFPREPLTEQQIN